MGTILHPPHRNLDEIVNMKMFLDLVLYKNRGSVKQLGVVADLIKPFFKDFEPLILNEKLLNKARKTAMVKGNLPQYVSWYKSWNNQIKRTNLLLVFYFYPTPPQPLFTFYYNRFLR